MNTYGVHPLEAGLLLKMMHRIMSPLDVLLRLNNIFLRVELMPADEHIFDMSFTKFIGWP